MKNSLGAQGFISSQRLASSNGLDVVLWGRSFANFEHSLITLFGRYERAQIFLLERIILIWQWQSQPHNHIML